MVNNLGRGFFYTIGRILALAFIGLVIGTLLIKISPDITLPPNWYKGAIM